MQPYPLLHTCSVMILGRTRSASHPRIEYSIIDFLANSEDPRSIAEWSRQWLTAPETRELFEHFGHPLAATGLGDLLAEAEESTRSTFDFRQGGERWEARRTEFSPQVTGLVDHVVDNLYREPSAAPSVEIGPVTHALVLGGRINSCILRGELLDRLLNDGLEVGAVWGLGSRRQVTDEEHRVAAELELGDIEDELDAMTVALRHTLHLPMPPTRDSNAPSEVRPLRSEPVPVIGLAAAPGNPDKPRATTSDTYSFFRDTAGELSPSDHILIVTSAIHAPFQHAQAIAELGVPTGAKVTSVGAHIGTTGQPSVRHTWTTAEWLQEIRSTIWSMRNMYEVLQKANPGIDLD